MANRATVTYNGAIISTEDKDGSFAVVYNGNTLATLGAGQSKTLNCSGQPMKTDIVVGEKTLRCKNLKMHTDILIAVASLFPSAPSAYNLIGTYTSSQTWTAPESGYFQIELFGASGNGGKAINASDGGTRGGGGGGGGGYTCSRIKMNKGDTIVLTVGATGVTTIAKINSGVESYSSPQVTSGANGGDGTNAGGGKGGAGGVGSNGNYSNATGGAGTNGQNSNAIQGATGGTGGAGASGAPNGGNGASIKGLFGGSTVAAGSGSSGFFKIYRGNTNVV